MVLGIAAGRIALGAGALLAPRPALRALGFPQPDPAGLALARFIGGRDLALATLTFLARDDAAALRSVALTAACVDAVDAVCFGLAGREEELRRAGVGGSAAGAAAALAGAWAGRKLRS